MNVVADCNSINDGVHSEYSTKYKMSNTVIIKIPTGIGKHVCK